MLSLFCKKKKQETVNFLSDLCLELDIEVHEHLAHTLWDPMEIISCNGGIVPLTFDMFLVAIC